MKLYLKGVIRYVFHSTAYLIGSSVLKICTCTASSEKLYIIKHQIAFWLKTHACHVLLDEASDFYFEPYFSLWHQRFLFPVLNYHSQSIITDWPFKLQQNEIHHQAFVLCTHVSQKCIIWYLDSSFKQVLNLTTKLMIKLQLQLFLGKLFAICVASGLFIDICDTYRLSISHFYLNNMGGNIVNFITVSVGGHLETDVTEVSYKPPIWAWNINCCLWIPLNWLGTKWPN